MTASTTRRGRAMDPNLTTRAQDHRRGVLARRHPEIDWAGIMLADGTLLLTGIFEDDLDVLIAVNRKGTVVRSAARYLGPSACVGSITTCNSVAFSPVSMPATCVRRRVPAEARRPPSAPATEGSSELA
jgi:hypothetical protein